MEASWNLGFFVVVLLLLAQTKAAEDAIAAGESLTGTQTRISRKGIFKLGFFNLNGTEKWYVGMWFAQVPETIAWVTNRDYPLQNNSASLNFTEDGGLAIYYGRSVIWSTNVTKKASSAALLDSGNLVVYGAANKSEIIWESFDYPGNTWLPEMKMRTGQKLTSWKSPWDASPGRYNLEMPEGSITFALLWNNSIRYWDCGDWDGQRFAKIPEMSENNMYSFSFYNGTPKYFTYSVKQDASRLARFVVADSGDIQVSAWLYNTNSWTIFCTQPRDRCDVYALCGAYGSCKQNNVQFCNCLEGFEPKDSRAWKSQEGSGGCARRTGLDCHGNQTTDGFVELIDKSTPANGLQLQGYSSIEQCKAACLSNCSCTAYNYVTNGTSPVCQMWFSELVNLRDTSSNPHSLFVRLAASDLPKTVSHKKAIVSGAVAVGVGLFVAIIAVILGLFFFWCRRAPPKSAPYGSGSLTVFSYRELQIATSNFSERLGGGGFGSVFKGSLQDKTEVAVKKLESINQGEKQFRTEVSTIGIIQHVNLVRLRGFCSEGSSRLLVYDYMPHGSLNSFLFSKTEGAQVLDWKTRFGIALGTARGILYLHEKCRDCIIHCDIKPENILVDSDFSPKLADFGLAKLVGREFSHVLTTMRGTRGYLAPEWISGLPITAKADVYSFGMTLLEIISGRRNMDWEPEASELFFPTWASMQINMGNTIALLDKKLNGDADAEQLKRAAMVGGWCIQDDEDARPSMSQVVQILEGIHGDVAVPPIPMSLQALVAKTNSLVFYWDKETAYNTNTSSSAGSNPATPADDFSNSNIVSDGSDNVSNHVTYKGYKLEIN